MTKQPKLVNASPAPARNPIGKPPPAPSMGGLEPVPPAASQDKQHLELKLS